MYCFKYIIALAAMSIAFLSGCVFSGSNENADANRIKSGAYYSDYGASGRSQGHESELVLDTNGGFHFFEMGDSTPWVITRGDWKSENSTLILKSARRRNAHYSYVFDYWDSIPVDTSYLRGISDGGFERLELSRDSGFYFDVVRWIRYQKLEPLPILAEGHYECTEKYSSAGDTVMIHTGVAYMNLTHNGAYSDGRIEDGKPQWDFKSDHWLQSGSFLIVKSGLGRNYDSLGFTEWQPLSLDTNAEYVVRLRAIERDSFQQWVPEDQTLTGFPHWMTWRRKLP